MPEALYNAINGREGREMIKNRLVDYIMSRIPGMSKGNTFHQFLCTFRFQIFAFPDDRPTPNGEFSFEFFSPDFNKAELADFRDKFIEHKNNVQELIRLHEEISKVIEKNVDIITIEDRISAGSRPNDLRITEGLPVAVLEINQHMQRREEIHKDMTELSKRMEANDAKTPKLTPEQQNYGKPVTFDGAQKIDI